MGLLMPLEIASNKNPLSDNNQENKKTMAVCKPTNGQKAMYTANENDKANF